jgi:hypothetical protein
MFGETKIGLFKNGVEVNLKNFSEEKMHWGTGSATA